MPAGVTHFPDPGIQFGSFQVLPRTDGKWAVVDTRREPGARTVKAFSKKETAIETARKWHEAGHG